ncbi:MAG: hypothetical protein KDE56_15650 [Anaerolineales bacterium]|nr:hypothetical protein [Anaerolineales bacterium]
MLIFVAGWGEFGTIGAQRSNGRLRSVGKITAVYSPNTCFKVNTWSACMMMPA